MRVIIGVKTKTFDSISLKVIERKTSYGYELDFYDLIEDDLSIELGPEVFRSNPSVYDRSDFLISFNKNMFKNMEAQERFWELHEILEKYWSKSTGFHKTLIKSVIGIMVSQVKWQMGQEKLSFKVLERNLAIIRELKNEPDYKIIRNEKYPTKFHNSFLDDLFKSVQSAKNNLMVLSK
jgi:hypothetical protein